MLIIISFVFNIFLEGNAEAKCARDANNNLESCIKNLGWLRETEATLLQLNIQISIQK